MGDENASGSAGASCDVRSDLDLKKIYSIKIADLGSHVLCPGVMCNDSHHLYVVSDKRFFRVKELYGLHLKVPEVDLVEFPISDNFIGVDISMHNDYFLILTEKTFALVNVNDINNRKKLKNIKFLVPTDTTEVSKGKWSPISNTLSLVHTVGGSIYRLLVTTKNGRELFTSLGIWDSFGKITCFEFNGNGEVLFGSEDGTIRLSDSTLQIMLRDFTPLLDFKMMDCSSLGSHIFNLSLKNSDSNETVVCYLDLIGKHTFGLHRMDNKMNSQDSQLAATHVKAMGDSCVVVSYDVLAPMLLDYSNRKSEETRLLFPKDYQLLPSGARPLAVHSITRTVDGKEIVTVVVLATDGKIHFYEYGSDNSGTQRLSNIERDLEQKTEEIDKLKQTVSSHGDRIQGLESQSEDQKKVNEDQKKVNDEYDKFNEEVAIQAAANDEKFRQLFALYQVKVDKKEVAEVAQAQTEPKKGKGILKSLKNMIS